MRDNFNGDMGYWYQERDASILNGAQQVAELRAAEAGVQVDVGRALNNNAEARAGIGC